jgi:Sulfotransferase family
MMMRMLEQGGLPVLTDGERTPDDDNPNGYYEFEAVKQTREDATWLGDCEGKAVKMIYRLLYDLPPGREYRILFMMRQLEEVLASQRVMLRRKGMADDAITDDQMAALFRADLDKFRSWVAAQPQIALIDVNYNQVQENPAGEVRRINEFLGGHLNEAAMVQVVDDALYRNRAAPLPR